MQPTPLLLPGNMCDARLWPQPVRDALPGAVDVDLAHDASIAGMARRALGMTDGPLLPVGFSMGAIVAMEMALLAPGRIAGLVLAGYNATSDLPERAARRPAQQDEVRGGGLERVIVEELKPHYLAAANRGNGALLALLRDMGMALGADVFVAQSEALRLRDDRTAMLPKLGIPVLYTCGAEDRLCPPAWHRRWAAMTSEAVFAEVAGAGHMLPLEAPEALAGVIRNWTKHHQERLAA